MPSFYLLLEASQKRILALLDRIERERREDGYAKPESDFWKLPEYLQNEITRRLLIDKE